MWSAFHALVTDPLQVARIEFVVSPGNHDGSALPGFEKERRVFRKHWGQRLPRAELLPGSDWPRRHAFWLNDILVISIDGSRTGALSPADQQLLETAVVQAAHARFTLVVSHLPVWPFAQGRERETVKDPVLERLLMQGKIQFLISGHHHVFYSGKDQSGAIHLATGPLGGNARKIVGEENRAAFNFVVLDLCEESWRVSAMRSPEFIEEVDFGDLPERLTHGEDSLVRMNQSEDVPFRKCR